MGNWKYKTEANSNLEPLELKISLQKFSSRMEMTNASDSECVGSSRETALSKRKKRLKNNITGPT